MKRYKNVKLVKIENSGKLVKIYLFSRMLLAFCIAFSTVVST